VSYKHKFGKPEVNQLSDLLPFSVVIIW